MTNLFFIADTHFGHANIINFKRNDGSPLRAFASIEEHDEHLVAQWNSLVKPSDKVYHLGDCVINRRCLPTLGRLNGHKRLVRGNHDIFRTSEYLKYFDEILAYRVFSEHKFICSHIPIHPDCMERWNLNVHGHLHYNKIMGGFIETDTGVERETDPRYLCVSVEHTNYAPVPLEAILQKMKEVGGE